MKTTSLPLKGFATKCLHGASSFTHIAPHLPPIYATSTFVQEDARDARALLDNTQHGYIYGRMGNPTTDVIAQMIASLEGHATAKDGSDIMSHALMTASGMGAISTLILSLLKKGDSLLTHRSLYGGTHYFLNYIASFSISTHIADLHQLHQVEDILRRDTSVRLIYIETPTNPTLSCYDIEALTTLAHQYEAYVVCDNTITTPYLQQPLKWGVDFVVHSATKFLNGHGTSIAGVIIGRDKERMKKVASTHTLLGAIISPFDAYLIYNGIKTLSLRMQRHIENARIVYDFLKHHKQVERVVFTGAPDHPQATLIAKQMRDGGCSLLSLYLKGDTSRCMSVMNKLQLITKAVSLGTPDTMICHPYTTTHLNVSEEEKKSSHITDNLLRITVGLEDAQDLIYDFAQALA